jgi:hypothetical protein
MRNTRWSALRELYVRETRGFIFLADESVAMILWVVGIVAVFGLISSAASTASANQQTRGTIDALDSAKARISYYASHGYARLTPALDSTGATNCTGAWCREIDFHVREADNVDRYVGFDYTGNGLQEVKFTALTVAGGRTGLANVGNLLPLSGFQVHKMAASQLASDANNPYAGFVGALWAAAGHTPTDVTVNYGSTGTIGANDVVLIRMWAQGAGDEFEVAPVTLVSKDVTIGVGWYAPTPAPALAVSGLNGRNGILYHWPTDPSGPTSFQVSEADYHDAFFAEDGSCGGVAVPSPNYVNGSSPAYVPSSMWGSAGPWVYPNPNPTSPPGQPSGPGTFAFQAQNPGVCSMGVYDANTNRGSAADATFGVQVMGPLQVNPTGYFFAYPTASAQQMTTSKTYDSENLVPSVGSGCNGIASETISSYLTQGSPTSTPTQTLVSVSPIAAGVCSVTVGDQYGEPTANVNVTVAGALQVLNSSQVPVGTVDIPINGGGGWSTVSLEAAKSYLPVGLVSSINLASCSGYVGLSGPGSDQMVGVNAEQPFGLTGLAATGGCTIQVSDQYGEVVSVQIVVDAQPAPSPTPTASPTCPPNTTGTYPNCITTPPLTPTPAPYPVQKYEIFDGTYACASNDPFCNNGEQFFPVGQVAVLLSNGDVFTNLSDIEQPGSTTLFAQLAQCVAHGTSILYSSGTPYSGGWTAGIPLSGYETQFDNGNGGNVNQFPQIPACDPTSLNCSSYLTYSYYLVGAFDWIGYLNSTFTQANGWYSQAYQLQNCN